MSGEKLSFSPQEQSSLVNGFTASFGGRPDFFFSAPGRTEIGGNHTDHQRGCVLAGAVNLDTRAAVRENEVHKIRICSRGFPPAEVDLKDLAPRLEERNTTPALIRGVAAGFIRLGCKAEGFDAYCESTVLPGSGLSSSAAFEVLIGTIINHLSFQCRLSSPEVARICQAAETEYFGKPCGLMDQAACAVGNLVYMDFLDEAHPKIEPVDFDFSSCGYALCIIDSQASHADLTDEYAAIPGELKQISAHFQKQVLREIPEESFYAAIPALRKACGDRAVLRAIHFYSENARVPRQVAALRSGDFHSFLDLIQQSGESSWMYLQNVIPSGSRLHQDMAVTLALCRHFLNGRGAFRVHGGGFAGTVQAFVPLDLLNSFCCGMENVLGTGACHVLSVRPQGGVFVGPVLF